MQQPLDIVTKILGTEAVIMTRCYCISISHRTPLADNEQETEASHVSMLPVLLLFSVCPSTFRSVLVLVEPCLWLSAVPYLRVPEFPLALTADSKVIPHGPLCKASLAAVQSVPAEASVQHLW